MAILFSQADGSDQHYDTYEEFEKALILIKRLNGEKVPQDLLDEVREKYDGKDPKTSQVEIDGHQDLEALGKAVEAFFKGIDDTEEDVNMENLPIGTLVKVVGNRAGHWHEVGEILPITEVVEGNLSEMYRLDGRTSGWVSVNDIEFVSFPEEEDSTSGDEVFEEEDSEKYPAVGTKVKAKINTFCREKGKVYEVLDNHEADKKYPIIVTDEKGTTSTSMEKYPIRVTDERGSTSMSVERFEEIFEVLNPSEEDSEIKLGDRVRLIDADDPYRVNVPVGTEGTVTGRDFDGDYEVDFEYTYVKLNQTAGIDQIEKVPEDSEIKAGDTVIATEDEFDITEGVEYEIKERETGTLYFLDDDGDIRRVSDHEEILRKKSDNRGFKKGDVVYVNEEITDSSGDYVCPGVLAEFIESQSDKGVLTPDGLYVVVEDGDIGKLTLVCRAEDRLDK